MRASVAAAVDAVRRRFGRLDFAVNCAGARRRHGAAGAGRIRECGTT